MRLDRRQGIRFPWDVTAVNMGDRRLFPLLDFTSISWILHHFESGESMNAPKSLKSALNELVRG